MCMEDIKIHRKTRWQQLKSQVSMASGTLYRISGNPSRLSLILGAQNRYVSNIDIFARDDYQSFITRVATTGMTRAGMPVFDGFGVLDDYDAFMPVVGTVLHIRDYGQILLGDLWISPSWGSSAFNIFETFLMERESGEL